MNSRLIVSSLLKASPQEINAFLTGLVKQLYQFNIGSVKYIQCFFDSYCDNNFVTQFDEQRLSVSKEIQKCNNKSHPPLEEIYDDSAQLQLLLKINSLDLFEGIQDIQKGMSLVKNSYVCCPSTRKLIRYPDLLDMTESKKTICETAVQYFASNQLELVIIQRPVLVGKQLPVQLGLKCHPAQPEGFEFAADGFDSSDYPSNVFERGRIEVPQAGMEIVKTVDETNTKILNRIYSIFF